LRIRIRELPFYWKSVLHKCYIHEAKVVHIVLYYFYYTCFRTCKWAKKVNTGLFWKARKRIGGPGSGSGTATITSIVKIQIFHFVLVTIFWANNPQQYSGRRTFISLALSFTVYTLGKCENKHGDSYRAPYRCKEHRGFSPIDGDYVFKLLSCLTIYPVSESLSAET
jgi:hypothetical protein